MVQQVEAARREGEATRTLLRAEFAQQAEDLASRIDSQRNATEAYQRALQNALEERLAEFANHQHVRLNELDARFAGVVPAGDIAVQVANVTQGLRDYVENQTSAFEVRLNDLHRNANRFDEQANALVHHVNETTQALAARIDAGDQKVMQEIDHRMGGLGGFADTLRTELEAQLVEHRGMLTQRVDSADMKFTDRMLALETRVNDTHGTKIATLEATIGRVGSGFDEALTTLSQRSAELQSQLIGVESRLDELTARVANVDIDALDEMKEKLSSAIGEAMLVRIEVDRVVASTDEKLDKHTMRMAEIEAKFNDEMDVGTAVQLERLDELERALVELDPNQFVRKVDPTVADARPSDVGEDNREPTPHFAPHLPAGQPAPASSPSTEPSLSS